MTCPNIASAYWWHGTGWSVLLGAALWAWCKRLGETSDKLFPVRVRHKN